MILHRFYQFVKSVSILLCALSATLRLLKSFGYNSSTDNNSKSFDWRKIDWISPYRIVVFRAMASRASHTLAAVGALTLWSHVTDAQCAFPLGTFTNMNNDIMLRWIFNPLHHYTRTSLVRPTSIQLKTFQCSWCLLSLVFDKCSDIWYATKT